jgi:hypothetical protein
VYPASEAPWRLPLISGTQQKSKPQDTRRDEFAIFIELWIKKAAQVLNLKYSQQKRYQENNMIL